MKKFVVYTIALVVVCILGVLASSTPVLAQGSITYSVGTVSKVLTEEKITIEGNVFFTQELEVKLASDASVVIHAGTEFQPLKDSQRLQTGRKIIVAAQPLESGETEYVIADVYRLPTLWFLTIALFVLVIWIGRTRGFMAIIGMVLSMIVLVRGIVPALLAGYDPVLVASVGSVLVAAVTIYLSHGWSLKSHIAFGSIVVTLIAVLLLSLSSVHAAQLVGLGSEEAYFLQFGPAAQVNLQGLLLAGILLGALGVLDDIIVSQVSLIHELKAVQPKLSFEDLYWRGLEVGRDHVASLVNTLLLAYAGANLPLFLLFFLNTQSPVWVTLNSDIIAEEFMRTVIGSIGLVAAVPLTTAVAAAVFSRRAVQKSDVGKHSHIH